MVALNTVRASNAKIGTTFPPGLVAVFSRLGHKRREGYCPTKAVGSGSNKRHWGIYFEAILSSDTEASGLLGGKVHTI